MPGPESHSMTIPTSTTSAVIPPIAMPISTPLPAVEVPSQCESVVAAASVAPAPVAPLSTPFVFLLQIAAPDPPDDVVVAVVPVLLVTGEIDTAPFPFFLPSSRIVTAVMDFDVSLAAKLKMVLVATIPELVTVHTAGDKLQL